MKSSLHVVILGSGVCVPSLERSSCAALVSVGENRILLDIGPGTMRRLLEAGVAVHDVDYLLLSHFHPDHSGELASFLFANKYPDENRRKRPLTLVGGRGFLSFLDDMKRLYGRWIELEPGKVGALEMDNRGPDHRRFDSFVLETRPMAHNEESVAYRITGPSGASVVYSGDTDENERLVQLAAGADLLICESALPDAHKVPGHLTPSRAGNIAAKAGVKKLVLTHFYPECDAVDMAAQCRKSWNGPLALAEDLMRFTL